MHTNIALSDHLEYNQRRVLGKQKTNIIICLNIEYLLNIHNKKLVLTIKNNCATDNRTIKF